MSGLLNETARILSNEAVGPRLHLMVLEAPGIAAAVKPGQFVHMKVPGAEEHILRRPFSIYSRNLENGTLDILYQEVGSLTRYMPGLVDATVEMIGPVGNCWTGALRHSEGTCSHALLVGGGVGAAPLFMLAEALNDAGCTTDVVLGAQTYEALVARTRYEDLFGHEPFCATDDGTYGHLLRSGWQKVPYRTERATIT